MVVEVAGAFRSCPYATAALWQTSVGITVLRLGRDYRFPHGKEVHTTGLRSSGNRHLVLPICAVTRLA